MTKDYEGPTAEEILPAQRLNEGMLYQEDLVAMFGEAQALRGVPLEIVDATGGTLKTEPTSKKKGEAANKTKATILLTFKAPDGKALPKKLGINKTIKKALIARFDSAVLARWVGWVTLYVDPEVEDRRSGEKVRAIRAKSVGPKLAPTFDYAENTRKRIARAIKLRDQAGGAKTSAAAPPAVELTPEQRAALDAADEESTAAVAGDTDLTDRIRAQMERGATAGSGIADAERAAIAATEREQFTQDPEDEQ